MIRKHFIAALLLSLAFPAMGQDAATRWYRPAPQDRPFVRWWWLGSAVDREGLTYNLEQFAAKGIGGVEITPIYGVQGNEANDIEYLSPEWMEMYRHVCAEAERLGLEVDMNCGTGWPFGGPGITERRSAKKMDLREDGTIAAVPTGQKVKRAAPGGEGLVLDHYDREAVDFYLERFDKAFGASGAPWPSVLFNDSYEVYGADWTEKLPEVFRERYGYDIVAELAGPRDTERYVRAVGPMGMDPSSATSRTALRPTSWTCTRWWTSRNARLSAGPASTFPGSGRTRSPVPTTGIPAP